MTTTAVRSPTGNGAVVIPEEGEGAGGERNRKMPTNKSSQKLVNEDFLQNSTSSSPEAHSSTEGLESSHEDNANLTASTRRSKVSKMEWVTVFILFFVNLINYMDRYTLAGKPISLYI